MHMNPTNLRLPLLLKILIAVVLVLPIVLAVNHGLADPIEPAAFSRVVDIDRYSADNECDETKSYDSTSPCAFVPIARTAILVIDQNCLKRTQNEICIQLPFASVSIPFSILCDENNGTCSCILAYHYGTINLWSIYQDIGCNGGGVWIVDPNVPQTTCPPLRTCCDVGISSCG